VGKAAVLVVAVVVVVVVGGGSGRSGGKHEGSVFEDVGTELLHDLR
jgi:hypothetical protein